MPDHSAAVWLGVDIGTQSVRASAVDESGHVLGTGVHQLHSVRAAGVHVQNPESWWVATCHAITHACALLRGRQVCGLSVASTSGTVVVVDRSGRPASEGLMYDDARAGDLLGSVQEAGGEVWQRSGYRMQASWALPKIVWLARQGLLTPGTTVRHQGDFILSRLAAQSMPTDTSTALKAGVDLTSGRWPSEVLTVLGVPESALPELVGSGTVVGTVLPALAASLGLGDGCRLVTGMTDACAAQIAAGAVRPGRWNTVMGTTMVIKGVSQSLLDDPSGAVYSHRAPFATAWYPGGASSTGARAFQKWLPDAALSELTAGAATIEDPPLAYPLTGTGERFPFVDAEARPAHEPGFDEASAAARFAGMATGIAYLERHAYASLSAIGADLEGPIGFTGGGARNSWWNQLRCDVLGREVAIVSPPRTATPSGAGGAEHRAVEADRDAAAADGSIGMAVLAAAAVSGTGSPAERLPAAASLMLAPATILSPRASRRDGHEDGYGRFLALLERARDPTAGGSR